MSGATLAHLGRKLRGNPPRHKLMDDFLGLGLISVVYGLSLLVDAWGFLAVFFAAVALRQTELKLVGADMNSTALDNPDRLQTGLREPGAKNPGSENPGPENGLAPTVSEGALVFKEHLERLSELVLILLIGGTLFIDSWSWRAVGLALFLFMVARPVSVLVGLLGTRTSWPIRSMVGWFGVRGIGSLYYLMFAIQHGLPEDLALDLIRLTLIAVTLSILVHGISVKPLMKLFLRYSRRRSR